MYVSATDREKLGQVTTTVYMSSTEEVLYWLFCCLCMQRSDALLVYSLHFTFIWNSFRLQSSFRCHWGKGPITRTSIIVII